MHLFERTAHPTRPRVLIFWEPIASPHKLALAAALARRADVASIQYFAERGLSEDLLAQGWRIDPEHGVNVVQRPSAEQITAAIKTAPQDAIHLISGLGRTPMIAAALKEAQRSGARFAIQSEPRASEGLAGWLRYAHSWVTEYRIRGSASFVLAIGRHGPDWFRSTGYPASCIFPFAYFLPGIVPQPRRATRDSVRIGFLGRLVPAKGIDLFLDAFTKLPLNMVAHVAGHGIEADRVKEAEYATEGRLNFHGSIPMQLVGRYLNELDLLVVPSRTTQDGWAAVVSEALMAGVGVVATRQVGASVCLDEPWRGQVVNSLTTQSLVKAIECAAQPELLTDAARARRSCWARARLTGEAGADYLMRILAHVYDGAPRPAAFFADG